MVLSCYCSFFDQIFASETNNQVNNSFVDIPDVDGKFLELLVQYIYTGQICLDSDNVLNILAAAHYGQMGQIWHVSKKRYLVNIFRNFFK